VASEGDARKKVRIKMDSRDDVELARADAPSCFDERAVATDADIEGRIGLGVSR